MNAIHMSVMSEKEWVLPKTCVSVEFFLFFYFTHTRFGYYSHVLRGEMVYEGGFWNGDTVVWCGNEISFIKKEVRSGHMRCEINILPFLETFAPFTVLLTMNSILGGESILLESFGQAFSSYATVC